MFPQPPDIPFMAGVIGMTAVLATFITPIIIIFLIMRHKAARTRMLHETIQKLTEKGQPIPPELFQDMAGKRRDANDKKRSPLHNGIQLIAIGLGLIVMFLAISGGNYRLAGFGFIPLLMGIGYLLIWKLESRNENNQAQ